MVQTLASPLSGILGDRYDRVAVLASGAFIWGLMTSAMAMTATLHQVTRPTLVEVGIVWVGFGGLHAQLHYLAIMLERAVRIMTSKMTIGGGDWVAILANCISSNRSMQFAYL